MPGFVGADVDQLRALSRTFADSADRLQRMTAEINSRLGAATWRGPDADRYRAQWQSESVRYLRAASDALHAAALTLARNADQQQHASSAASTVGVSGGQFPWDPLHREWTTPVPGTDPVAVPNPFDQYQDLVKQTPIWPISLDTALGVNPGGAAIPAVDGVAVSQWGDVVDAVSRADFSANTIQLTTDYIAANPGDAFKAATDAVAGYLNPLGK